ncbi:MAG: protein kinase, partial [Anaerolineales bacterium]|nr:protein kinase [Anaerolineales bacterium]
MSSDSKIGRQIGKYKIVEHLGRGGMAEVYKAYHENLDRFVAVKLMHPFLAGEQDFLSRFQREARAMAALNHPNIIDVFDFDVEGDVYYIVMAYISGGTLKDAQTELANQGQKMALSRAIQIILEVADALSYAHSRGMLHRDIKPANIMLNERGAAVLTDFGIAKIMSGPSYTATGAMIGTPAYMSPEQGIGQPGDERSDLYSLGVLFYQVATGVLPYDADTPLAVVLKHVNEPIPSPKLVNPDLPPEIEEIIFKAMAKDPEERYQSVHEFARALRQAVRQSNIDLAAVPPSLLRDKPTPLPVKTVSSQSAETALGSAEAATVVADGGLDPTMVGNDAYAATVVASPSDPTVVSAPPADTGRKLPVWVPIVGVLVVIAAIFGILSVTGVLGGSATPTVSAVAAVPTDTATPEPEDTPTLTPTVDFEATTDAQAAAVIARLTDQAPTATPTRTATETPSPTATASPTVDATAAFLADCEQELTLISQYTSPNQANTFAPISSNFQMNLVLENSGTCPIPAGLELRYTDGTEFDESSRFSAPVLEEPLLAGEQVTLELLLIAPATVSTFDSTWALFDAEDEQFGEPFEFEVNTYVPATATPTRPPATSTPTVAESTPASEVNVQFNTFFSDCEYPGGGTEWRCEMVIAPYGGAGNQYTIFVFDSEPPARYLGSGNQVHFITARRCSPWIHEVKVQDEASGASVTKNIYFDP